MKQDLKDKVWEEYKNIKSFICMDYLQKINKYSKNEKEKIFAQEEYRKRIASAWENYQAKLKEIEMME